MHVFQGGPVVVLQRQLVADLRQESVVNAWVAEVVRERSDQQHILLQLGEEGLRVDQRHQPRHTMQNIDGVRETVEGHGEVLLFHCAHEALEYLKLHVRGAEAVGVEETRNCEHCQTDPLGLRERERIEVPRVVDFLRHAEVFQADGPGERFLAGLVHPRDGAGLAGLRDGLLLVHYVFALHHAEDADVLVAHVIGRLDVLGSVQLCNNRQLLDDPLQELHLVRAFDVRLFVLGLANLCAELEYGRGDLPDRHQHALERAHGQFGDDARERQAAKDHQENDEHYGHYPQTGLQLVGRVHIESDHDVRRIYPQR
mmetsp:Transcript_97445/g.297756  ORF Transcript_97445/g.297756 Transcript_97445/m.297756 type:complete len:313 (+) Transcript_97445:992-1930(+)